MRLGFATRFAFALALAVTPVLLPGAASAQPAQQQERPRAEPEVRKLPAEQTTRHTLDIGGRATAFTATVGTVPLFDGEGGALIAEIGFVAFRHEGGDVPARGRSACS